ncbi:MAG: hypothetical protein SPK15_02755 [Candidatus Onthomorpha sp.]|nr:hypothetical protein [Candidatus Onthomorpha sp.]
MTKIKRRFVSDETPFLFFCTLQSAKTIAQTQHFFGKKQNKNDFFSTFAVQNGDWNVEHQQQKGG